MDSYWLERSSTDPVSATSLDIPDHHQLSAESFFSVLPKDTTAYDGNSNLVQYDTQRDSGFFLDSFGGDLLQPDQIFQLDQPLRPPDSRHDAIMSTYDPKTSPPTLLDLGSGTIHRSEQVTDSVKQEIDYSDCQSWMFTDPGNMQGESLTSVSPLIQQHCPTNELSHHMVSPQSTPVTSTDPIGSQQHCSSIRMQCVDSITNRMHCISNDTGMHNTNIHCADNQLDIQRLQHCASDEEVNASRINCGIPHDSLVTSRMHGIPEDNINSSIHCGSDLRLQCEASTIQNSVLHNITDNHGLHDVNASSSIVHYGSQSSSISGSPHSSFHHCHTESMFPYHMH